MTMADRRFVTEWGVRATGSGLDSQSIVTAPQWAAEGLIGHRGYIVFTRQVLPRVVGEWEEQERGSS